MSHKEAMERAAREAGKILLAHFRSDHKYEMKEDKSIVTQADGEAERRIIGILAEAYDYGMLAEESGEAGRQDGLVWVIDPLDGTNNFSHGLPLFCTMIGLAEGGVPIEGVVYDPLSDEIIYGGPGKLEMNGTPIMRKERNDKPFVLCDINPASAAVDKYFPYFGKVWSSMEISLRQIGCAGLTMASVGLGRADAFIGAGQQPWDFAAPMAICAAAGLEMTDWRGEPLTMRSTTALIAAPALHGELLRKLKE